MAAAVTYEGAVARNQQNDVNSTTSLFAGQKLWFSKTVPQRQWFVQNAQSNGATITDIDVQADIVLFDHTRKNAPPGSISYKYVELSIRNGVLEDVERHRIASESRVTRLVGSARTAAKGTRNAYTDAEDQLLWNYIKPYMDNGGLWQGNEIYKQLEAFNPRHTYQSWRDRWIKHTRFQNRQITAQLDLNDLEGILSNGRSPKRRRLEGPDDEIKQSIPIARQTKNDHEQNLRLPVSTSKTVIDENGPEGQPKSTIAAGHGHWVAPNTGIANFTEEEARMLFRATPRILNTVLNRLDQCWDEVAKAYPVHTKDAWRNYFEVVIVPEYRRRKKLDSEVKLQQHLLEIQLREAEEEAPEPKAKEGREKQGSPVMHQTTGSDPQATNKAQEKSSEASRSVFEMRPPEPNEARKRRHGRGSQSEFAPGSQSISSQSQSKSQPSQTSSNGHLPDIPHRTEEQIGLNVIRPVSSQVDATHVPHLVLLGDDPGAAVVSLEDTFVSNGSQNEQRFVTQASINGSIQSEQESSNPERSGVISPPSTAPMEMPMFFSDSSERMSSQRVELVDEGPQESQPAGNLSDYAPSETASVLDFQDNPNLSMGWDTAPEQQRASQGSQTQAEANPRSLSPNLPGLGEAAAQAELTQFKQQTNIDAGHSSIGLITEPATNLQGETQYETAPSMVETNIQRERHQQSQLGKDKENGDPATANIFLSREEQSRLPDEDSLFFIPAPEGGWSEDEEEVVITSERVLSPNGSPTKKFSPQMKIEDHQPTTVTETVAPEGEEADVESWLILQKRHYTDISPMILEEICVKSLEATSLQLDAATEVVISLVQTYTKGKHPAISQLDPFADYLSTTRPNKKKRTSRSLAQAISQMVDELMPKDQRGVWTKEDDRKLTGTNAREVHEVERKHGKQGVRVRFDYLEELYKDD